jgi:dTDP-4-amino-4,6-dideoxy-D-galactose acyltransferase
MIEILDWDTNFFNKKIGRINQAIENGVAFSNIEDELIKHHVDLAYYSSNAPLSDTILSTENYSLNLVDKKTTYIKPINPTLPFNIFIKQYKANYPDEQLLKLSVASGEYSRFNVDKQIGTDKFEELYELWIINSVSKKIAQEVLVYELLGSIVGFVTLGEKNSRADIGIIAVDKEHRGKGIGKALMYSAENWFANHSTYKDIQVVTQGSNKPACRLYESCGYKVDNVQFFYHLWKKDND